MRGSNMPPPERVLCLDIETVPDRDRLPDGWGDKFPKTLHHKVCAVSFVEAELTIDGDGCERLEVIACRSGGEPDWNERRLLEGFWKYFSKRPTRLVTWNGRGFDVPCLLHRTMIHCLPAHGYFGSSSRFDSFGYRYAVDRHCDLMDVLADHGASAKLGLDETAAAVGLPGKLGGHGSEVEKMVADGEIDAVRRYCEADVLNTYGLFLRHGVLTGRMTMDGYCAAIGDLVGYLDRERSNRPHLGEFLDLWTRSDDLITVLKAMNSEKSSAKNAPRAASME